MLFLPKDQDTGNFRHLDQEKNLNFPLFEEKEIYNTKVKLNCWPPGKKGEKVENMDNRPVVTDDEIYYMMKKDKKFRKLLREVLRIIDKGNYVGRTDEEQLSRGCVTEFQYGDGYIRLLSDPWRVIIAYCHQSLRDESPDFQ